MNIDYVNRHSKQVEREVVAGERLLRWAFESRSGAFFLEILLKKKFVSNLYGRTQDLKFSSRKIKPFIDKFSIDMSEAIIECPSKYQTFNDFFSRKLKSTARQIVQNPDILITPSDGKILAYENINIHSVFQIKDSSFSIIDLVGSKELAEEYDGGTFVVVRLAPYDYHRFHFIDNCSVKDYYKVNGHYYSVNPIALNSIQSLFCQNKRDISILECDNFGSTLYIEVGATFVGTIIQTFNPYSRYKKGDEKGYFKFGGSTVILLFKRACVSIDDDILKNTSNGLETKVYMGERIGHKI